MLPIVDPNRNNNRERVPYAHVMAAILWAQMLMPRRDFDRLMAGIQATAVVTGGYISYKIIDTIAKVVPAIYQYIELASEDKLPKNIHPESQEEADLIVKSIEFERDRHTNSDIEEPKAKKAKTTDTSVSNTPSSAYVTPARPKNKGPVTVDISPDGTLLKAPPGSKRRRIEPLEQQLIMADAEMASNDNPGGVPQTVTKVSRFPYAFEGIPRQYTTILPYEKRSFGTGVAVNPFRVLQIRMNSIYDIIKREPSTTDDWTQYNAISNTDGIYKPNPDPVSATVEGTVETPYWRDYWEQFYEYWTVVECRYKIRIWNSTDSADANLVVFWGYTGIQEPPLFLDPSAGTPVAVTYDDLRRWKGFKHQYIHSKLNAWEYNRYDNDRMGIIEGVYHPGDGTHEVVEDELAQTWIRGSAVPKENNNLTVVFVQAPGAQAPTIKWEVELEYVVQYKDQKVDWQFPRKTITSNFSKSN